MRTTTTAAPRRAVGSSLQSGHYTRKVLKNGLTVIAFESRMCPIVQITGAIRAGEAYEPTAKARIGDGFCANCVQ